MFFLNSQEAKAVAGGFSEDCVEPLPVVELCEGEDGCSDPTEIIPTTLSS